MASTSLKNSVAAHTHGQKTNSKGKMDMKFNKFITNITKASQGKIDINKHIPQSTDRYNNLSHQNKEIGHVENLNHSTAHPKDNSLRDQSELDAVANYVQEFKKEIENKFQNSVVNLTYILSKDLNSSEGSGDSSLDSIKSVTMYDLHSQNKKFHISVGLQINQEKKKYNTVLQKKNSPEVPSSRIQSSEDARKTETETIKDKNSPLSKVLFNLVETNIKKNANDNAIEHNALVSQEQFNSKEKNKQLVEKKKFMNAKKSCGHDVCDSIASNNCKAMINNTKPTDLHKKTNSETGKQLKGTLPMKKPLGFKNSGEIKGGLNNEYMQDFREKHLRSSMCQRDDKKAHENVQLQNQTGLKQNTSTNTYRNIKVKLESSQNNGRKMIKPNITQQANKSTVTQAKTELANSYAVSNVTVSSNYSPKSNGSHNLNKQTLKESSKDSSVNSLNSVNSSTSTLKISNLLGGMSSSNNSIGSPISNHSDHSSKEKKNDFQEKHAQKNKYSKLNSKLLSKLTAYNDSLDKSAQSKDNQNTKVSNSGMMANSVVFNTNSKIVAKGLLYQKAQNNIINLRSSQQDLKVVCNDKASNDMKSSFKGNHSKKKSDVGLTVKNDSGLNLTSKNTLYAMSPKLKQPIVIDSKSKEVKTEVDFSNTKQKISSTLNGKHQYTYAHLIQTNLPKKNGLFSNKLSLFKKNNQNLMETVKKTQKLKETI